MFFFSGRKAQLKSLLYELLGVGGSVDVQLVQIQNAVSVIEKVYSKRRAKPAAPAAVSDASGFLLPLPDSMNVGQEERKSSDPRKGNDASSRQLDSGKSGRVRCICLNPGQMPNMVQCSNPKCEVLQHSECVSRGLKGSMPHYCELCRIYFANPFWKPREYLVPARLMKALPGARPVRDLHGKFNAIMSLDQTFHLNSQQLSPCTRDPSDCQVQISCLLLEDEVPCRIYWPKHISLTVNSLCSRPYRRSLTSKMGINQRDAPLDATRMALIGRNSMRITTHHGGQWVVMVYIAERQSIAQIKREMKKEETKQESKLRMKKLLACDDELGMEQVKISLNDPMSCQRINVPARFDGASGPQPFDLDSFLSIASSNAKWQDPTTLQNSILSQMQIDTFVHTVLKCLRSRPDIASVEVNSEGNWRPEGGSKWYDICQEWTEEDEKDIANLTREDEASKGEDTTQLAQLDILEGNVEHEAMSALISIKSGKEMALLSGPNANGGNKNAGSNPAEMALGKRKAGNEPEVIELLSSDED